MWRKHLHSSLSSYKDHHSHSPVPWTTWSPETWFSQIDFRTRWGNTPRYCLGVRNCVCSKWSKVKGVARGRKKSVYQIYRSIMLTQTGNKSCMKTIKEVLVLFTLNSVWTFWAIIVFWCFVYIGGTTGVKIEKQEHWSSFSLRSFFSVVFW